MPKDRSTLKGALFALLAFAIFSSHDVVVKFLGGTYAPIQVVFFSVIFGLPLAMLMLMRDNAHGTLIPIHPWWTALRTAAAVMTGLCAFYAFSVLPLAQTYAIIFASPLIITVLSIPILGEVVRVRRWAAVAVGLVGVMIVLRPGTSELTLGHLAAFGCAVFGALASVIVRKIGREERPIVMVIYPLMANFLLMAALLPLVYKPMPLIDLGASALIALLALIASFFMIMAYRLGEASTIAPMQYSQIIWATLFGALFFDEWPDQATFIGAGIIILSGIYIVVRESGGASVLRPVLRTRSRPGTPSVGRVGQMLTTEERDRKGKPHEPG